MCALGEDLDMRHSNVSLICEKLPKLGKAVDSGHVFSRYFKQLTFPMITMCSCFRLGWIFPEL